MKYEDILIPTWCNYPDANFGVIGCYSLIYGIIESKEYCKECDCFNLTEVDNEKEVIDNQIIIRAYLDLLKKE